MIKFTTIEGWEITMDDDAQVIMAIDFKRDNPAHYCEHRGGWCYATSRRTGDLANCDRVALPDSGGVPVLLGCGSNEGEGR